MGREPELPAPREGRLARAPGRPHPLSPEVTMQHDEMPKTQTSAPAEPPARTRDVRSGPDAGEATGDRPARFDPEEGVPIPQYGEDPGV